MIIAKSIQELTEKAKEEKRLNETSVERLLKQARKNFRARDTVYVFFTNEEIDNSDFDQETCNELKEILSRPGEVAAVYHERCAPHNWWSSPGAGYDCHGNPRHNNCTPPRMIH